MIMHMGKKIVCVKEIPSNLIEEAIFILKSNATGNINLKFEERTKEIILDEAESIIDNYSIKIQEENNFEDSFEYKKSVQLKKELIYITGLFIVACIFISIVI